jgi:hypothetical protein
LDKSSLTGFISDLICKYEMLFDVIEVPRGAAGALLTIVPLSYEVKIDPEVPT